MTPQHIGIIIQARMGSTRLPGKILKPFGPYLLLEHILRRLSTLKAEATAVIATSDMPQDDVVESFCRERGAPCFRGSESDVLDRYYRCAVDFDFDHIVRLTGDNPFPDMDELDRLIGLQLAERADFCHSFAVLPIGVGAEIFTMKALGRSWREGHEPHHREHVDEYLLENPRLFRTLQLPAVPEKARPEIRLTVDTEEDYRRACYIIAHSQTGMATTVEAIALAEQYASVGEAA